MALRDVIPGPRMNFQVLGRADVGRIVPDQPYVVISITDCEREDALVADAPSCLGVLRLKFHDVQRPKAGKALMTTQDAQSIVRFIRQRLDKARLIICQCEAGFCRSAGVAAALSRWIQGDDALLQRQYLPNLHVYQLVWEAAQESDRHSSVNTENAQRIALFKTIGTQE